jgi:hypothetical protein
MIQVAPQQIVTIQYVVQHKNNSGATIFYYLMRHEPYGRRTTDVAVCERALTVSLHQSAMQEESINVKADKVKGRQTFINPREHFTSQLYGKYNLKWSLKEPNFFIYIYTFLKKLPFGSSTLSDLKILRNFFYIVNDITGQNFTLHKRTRYFSSVNIHS